MTRTIRITSSIPRTISLIDLPESSTSVLYSIYDALSSIDTTRYEPTREEHGAALFDVRIVANRKSAFRCADGMPVSPHYFFSEVDYSDIVIVTDLVFPPKADPRGHWSEATKWIRNAYERDAIICSVSTGSVLLAEAGLLNHQKATTHPSMNALFKRYYTSVKLVPERVLVPSGPNQRIITCGSVGAWQELVLYLIARFRDEAEAFRIAKAMTRSDNSDDPLPSAAISKPRRHNDALIADCQVWIAKHYAQPDLVEAMIKHSGLSDKTFKLRFWAATGCSPFKYIQILRIEEARQILETEELPTEEIGHLVGYEDPAFFRHLFKKRTGVTPDQYRQRFLQIAYS